MVWIQNLWADHARCICGHLRRHRVRQIHRQKGDVDLPELAHLRDVLRIACDINTLIAERDDIAAAITLGMKRCTVRSLVHDVVGRYCLNLHSGKIT